MPQYEICYLDATGHLLGTYCVACAADKQARILAHAMRLPGARRIEVWHGANLIYERPETHHRAAIAELSPALHAAE